jgi:hypothetical protein
MAVSPSAEGEEKDEKADLQLLCIRETHSSYNRPLHQKGQLGILLTWLIASGFYHLRKVFFFHIGLILFIVMPPSDSLEPA